MTDPAICDARVEELEMAIRMAEGLRSDLDPAGDAAQRLNVLVEQLRQRVNDVRHEQVSAGSDRAG